MKTWAAKQAIKTAKESLYPVFRHGAVFESGGRIIAKSCNVKKPITPKASMSTHAEVAGLKAILSKARLRRHTEVNLYVARINPRNQVVLSRPCERCLEAIKASGIVSSVYYSTDAGWEALSC